MKLKTMDVLKRKDGVALLTVVLIFLVLVILLGGVMSISLANQRGVKTHGQHTAAFYAAESGITVVVAELAQLERKNHLSIDEVNEEIRMIQAKFIRHTMRMSDNMGVPVYVHIALEDFIHDYENNKLTTSIVSTAEIGKIKRTVGTSIEFDYGYSLATPDIDGVRIRHVVLVRDTIRTGNGMITTMDSSNSQGKPRIATLSTQASRINLSGGFTFPGGEIELVDPKSPCENNTVVNSAFRCRVNGVILVEEEREVRGLEVRVNYPTLNFEPIRTQVNSVLSAPSNYTQITSLSSVMNGTTLPNGNYVIDNLDFSTSGIGTINVANNSNVLIVTNKLTLGNVSITGGGKMTIYVKPGISTFSPSSNGTIFGRTDNEDKLSIFVDTINGVGSSQYHVTFLNNSQTKGYLMFDNARIEFTQNSTLYGALFTGAVNGNVSAVMMRNRAHLSTGGGRSVIIAPNGKVHMENNSSMDGAIIARDFEQSNGGQSILRFDPDFTLKIPYEIISPIQIGDEEEPVAEVNRKLKVSATREH